MNAVCRRTQNIQQAIVHLSNETKLLDTSPFRQINNVATIAYYNVDNDNIELNAVGAEATIQLANIQKWTVV